MAFGGGTPSHAVTLEFETTISGDPVPVIVELTEVEGAGAVDVRLAIPPGSGDLLGFFGNVLDEDVLGSLTITDTAGLVRDVTVAPDGVRRAGPGNNVQPVRGWDFGLRLGRPGRRKGGVESATFRIAAPGLTDRQLARAATDGWVFGVRIQGTGGPEGSSKMGLRQGAPLVSISTPPEGQLVNAEALPVNGTVTGEDVEVLVDGGPAVVDEGVFRGEARLEEGGNTIVVTVTNPLGVARASRQVTLDSRVPEITITAPEDASTTARERVTVAGTVSDASPLEAFRVDGEPASVAPDGTFSAPASLFLGVNPVTVNARDIAGNQAAATVEIERGEPPTVGLTAPATGALVRTSPLEVRGTFGGEGVRVTVAGEAADLDPGTSTFRALVPLEEGTSTLPVVASNRFGDATTSLEVVHRRPPVVTITRPATGTLLAEGPVIVEGTVDDPEATVTINGVPAPVTAGSPATFSASVPLEDGINLLTASAVDPAGEESTTSVSVTLDERPPRVTIDMPAAGDTVTQSPVTVTGMINDIVVGTVNGQQAAVTVNGIEARVDNRSFVAEDVPLEPGTNTLTAVGTDRVGNEARATIEVVFEEPVGEPRLVKVSGDNQTGRISSQLDEALMVRLEDAAGQPVAGQVVVFRVVAAGGTLTAPDGETGRAVAVSTDESGNAWAFWSLGTTAGAGNQMVRASAAGFAGKAMFTATGLPGAPAKLISDRGTAQVGVVGQKLPEPFAVVVTDAGNNRLAGVPVRFEVTDGGGSLGGEEVVTVTTDPNGMAFAEFTLGPAEGIENNRVAVTLPDVPVAPVHFVASGRQPGDPAETTLSGVVLDNTDRPVPGVTVRLDGTDLSTVTDAEGQFVFDPAPVGHVHLVTDGSTATRPGTWPTLSFELVTVPGIDNGLGMPIHMLPIDEERGLFVDETTGGTLTLPEIPGLALDIEPGSATFPDGSGSGVVSLTTVHSDKIPMPPNFGQQPRLVLTIQPSGVVFDPPARFTLPNTDGLPPGAVTELYSFDHDLGQFVSVGPATVSEDGRVVRSNPGVGIIKGGWHCGGDPVEQGACCDCGECQRCDEGQGACVPDDSQDPGLPCVEVSAGEALSTATSVVESAIGQIPYVEDPMVDASVSAEACPGCCNGSVLPAKDVSISGSVEAQATIEKTLSPVDFEFEREATIFGFDVELEFELAVGPRITAMPMLSANVTGSRDNCAGENCLMVTGCGGATVSLGATATAEIEVEVEDSELELGVTLEAFATAPAAARVSYSSGALCDSQGSEVTGCLGDLTGTIAVSVFTFEAQVSYTFREGTEGCACF